MAGPDMDGFVGALLEGDRAAALAEVRGMTARGVSAETIVTGGLEVAMRQLDEKCTVERFNLLEIMLVGRAVTAVVNELYPEGPPPERGKGTFVIATLEGDVHDLGKNIVKMVLIGMGYRVVDMGRDCPLDKLVEATRREGAQAVLVSGLITTVIPQVRGVRPALAEQGLDGLPVIAGGAALKQASAEDLNVDYVADTAFDGAHYLDRRFGARA